MLSSYLIAQLNRNNCYISGFLVMDVIFIFEDILGERRNLWSAVKIANLYLNPIPSHILIFIFILILILIQWWNEMRCPVTIEFDRTDIIIEKEVFNLFNSLKQQRRILFMKVFLREKIIENSMSIFFLFFITWRKNFLLN